MNRKYKIKKTISMKQFIQDFGSDFSEHMKKRLMELEVRCVLTRKDDAGRLDLKHVEHILYDCSNSSGDKSGSCQKEYIYGQLVASEGKLFFSEACLEGPTAIKSPIVSEIYSVLGSEDIIIDENGNAKKVDDSNIDFVIDSILMVFPQVSDEYKAIMKDLIARTGK